MPTRTMPMMTILNSHPRLPRLFPQAHLKKALICGSGVGASITANKFSGVRAGLCHDSYSAHQGVEHDDMNILCLGARVVGIEVAKELIGAFVRACFTGEERHRRRLGKLIDIERKCLQNDT